MNLDTKVILRISHHDTVDGFLDCTRRNAESSGATIEITGCDCLNGSDDFYVDITTVEGMRDLTENYIGRFRVKQRPTEAEGMEWEVVNLRDTLFTIRSAVVDKTVSLIKKINAAQGGTNE